MSRFRQSRNWNESRWESEICRDERRINRYFSELAVCLDLPGEEDIIADAIAENTDLRFSGPGREEPLHCWSYLAPRTREEEEYEESDDRRPEQAIINLLDGMACQWNETCITTFPPDFQPAGLSIACFYSKLLARLADFADASIDPACDPGLRTTLGKRVLGDIQSLIEGLLLVLHFLNTLEQLVQKHIVQLKIVHDRIIALLGQ